MAASIFRRCPSGWPMSLRSYLGAARTPSRLPRKAHALDLATAAPAAARNDQPQRAAAENQESRWSRLSGRSVSRLLLGYPLRNSISEKRVLPDRLRGAERWLAAPFAAAWTRVSEAPERLMANSPYGEKAHRKNLRRWRFCSASSSEKLKMQQCVFDAS